VLVIAFASPIVELFVGNPTDPTADVAVPLVYVGATTSLGMWSRYLSYAATTVGARGHQLLPLLDGEVEGHQPRVPAGDVCRGLSERVTPRRI
jgi:hypothetical protein